MLGWNEGVCGEGSGKKCFLASMGANVCLETITDQETEVKTRHKQIQIFSVENGEYLDIYSNSVESRFVCLVKPLFL